MVRSRASAKAAGSRFEGQIAQALAHHLNDDRIERRAQRGSKDCGDIAGVRVHGQRLVVEAKDCARMDLAGWVKEAQTEAVNDGALAGVVVHKRVRSGDALDQYVTMTVREFIALLSGQKIVSV
jgi:hypothetical protein